MAAYRTRDKVAAPGSSSSSACVARNSDSHEATGYRRRTNRNAHHATTVKTEVLGLYLQMKRQTLSVCTKLRTY